MLKSRQRLALLGAVSQDCSLLVCGKHWAKDIDQYSETEVRELQRKPDSDDAVAELAADPMKNLPKQKSKWEQKCLPTWGK